MGDADTRQIGVPAELVGRLQTITDSDDLESTITREIARRVSEGGDSCSDQTETDYKLPLIAVERESNRPATNGQARAGRSEYSVIRKLGEGGMGRVELAHQRSLERDVAVKTLKRPKDDRHAEQALLREARITGQLEHPNVIPVHALGVDETGRPVLVIKRVEGVSWRTLIKQPRHELWERAFGWIDDAHRRHLEIFMEVCKAIHFAHTRGVIHRDIKPANVMVGEFGEVYVLDWGLATQNKTAPFAHAQAGAVAVPLGTPTFMAPEMLDETRGILDERTDVYLLGATLHYALTGHPRHRGADMIDVFESARLSEPFPYPSTVPEELANICNRATCARPEDRYQSAQELRDAVAAYLRHVTSHQLAAAATSRRPMLTQALTASEGGKDAFEAWRLFSEVRFAYQQALEEWAGNPVAQRGLQDCMEEMIEHQLARESEEAVASLIAELPERREALVARLEALRQKLNEQRTRNEGLQRMAADLDLNVAGRQKPWLFYAMGVLGLGCGGAFVPIGNRTLLPWNHDSAILVMSIFTGGTLAAIGLGRRTLLQNLANRRIVYLLCLGILSVLINRIVAAHLAVPLSQMLVMDMMLATVIGAAAGLGVDRAIGIVGAVFFVGVLVGAALPELSRLVFTVCTVIAFIFGAVLWTRRQRRRRKNLPLEPSPSEPER